MRSSLHKSLCCLLACWLLAVSPAAAKSGLIHKIREGIDEAAEGMSYVGRRAGQWLGDGLGLGEDKEAPFQETRHFNERHPTGPAPLVSLSNEFGTIRIGSWEERVVQVAAVITVGAESEKTAAALAGEVGVQVTASGQLVEITTSLPEAGGGRGLAAAEVNYIVTVPKGASLQVENFFGDTELRGVDGGVTLRSQYGAVELAKIGGVVHADVHGEFPFRAQNLAAGGVFQLHGAEAEFVAVGGDVQISNFRGVTKVRECPVGTRLEANADSGDIEVVLAPEAQPELTATVLFGRLASDLPVKSQRMGRRVVARATPEAPSQHLDLTTTFGDVHIRQDGAEQRAGTPNLEGAQSFNDTLKQTAAVTDGSTLALDAIVGDVTVTAADGNEVRITATRRVWTPAAESAPEALESLRLDVVQEGDRLHVKTASAADMAALECAAFRVDVQIACPRGLRVEVNAEDGHTHLAGLAGTVVVHQRQGVVSASGMQGALEATNDQGSVAVEDAAGPVTVSAQHGGVSLIRVAGAVAVENAQGRTVIEAPLAGVTVRSSGGEVRLLALDGVGGDYDVVAEGGNISMVVAPEASVAFLLKVQQGRIDSALPLEGRVTRDLQELEGRLNDGAHRVRLETRHGNIILN